MRKQGDIYKDRNEGLFANPKTLGGYMKKKKSTTLKERSEFEHENLHTDPKSTASFSLCFFQLAPSFIPRSQEKPRRQILQTKQSKIREIHCSLSPPSVNSRHLLSSKAHLRRKNRESGKGTIAEKRKGKRKARKGLSTVSLSLGKDFPRFSLSRHGPLPISAPPLLPLLRRRSSFHPPDLAGKSQARGPERLEGRRTLLR